MKRKKCEFGEGSNNKQVLQTLNNWERLLSIENVASGLQIFEDWRTTLIWLYLKVKMGPIV